MKKWFRRKSKVVTMQMGDRLEIYVNAGGLRHRLQLTSINSDLHQGTTVIFTDDSREHAYDNVWKF